MTSIALLVLAPQLMSMSDMIEYSHKQGIADMEIVIALGVSEFKRLTGRMPNLQPRKPGRRKKK